MTSTTSSAGARQALFKHILVPVDGSDHALDAARMAARLASVLGARLMLLTVYHGPSAALGEPIYSKALGEVLDEAKRTVERAKQVVLDARGPEPETEWLDGHAADTIISTAQAGGYDLVVMGTRGRGRLEAALLGSVSSTVAARAGRPVLIVGGLS